MTKENVFEPVLQMISSEDIKTFTKFLIDNECPDYFYTIGASRSGKYHPNYALGELGLAKHTLALCQILDWILNLEYMKNKFTSDERDLMIVSGLVHDWFKSGLPNNVQEHTVFTHPLLSGEMIRKYKDKFLTPDKIEFIAGCVESHMGEYNIDKYSGAILPKPTTEPQFIVHMADYLASRKRLEMNFSD